MKACALDIAENEYTASAPVLFKFFFIDIPAISSLHFTSSLEPGWVEDEIKFDPEPVYNIIAPDNVY
ncbi:hypothetical protein SDC9_139174 [bioreactor metagenome]|uniref:Uncharacterized protein n=1 Tax=bioreactor metagenome TaxID=1076179 RepID=A0A645DRC8_9ZZZZ